MTKFRRVIDQRVVMAVLLIVGISTIAAAADPFRFTEAEYEGGSLKYIGPIPVLTLTGSPEQIGEQAATLLKDVIPPLLETPRRVLGDFGVNYNLVLPLAASAARSMAAHSPERFRKEIDCIAAKAGVDANVLYVANSLVELRRMGGCAAFIATPSQSENGEMIFGRNFDFPTFDILDKYSCVVVVRPEGRRAFASVTVPGFIGVVSGINDAGLSIATLDVYSSADKSPIFDLNGAPLALTYRQILEECATVDEARALLEKTPRTTYMNLAVCDRDKAVVFELTPKTVGVREPEGALLRCTNHFELPGLETGVQCDRFQILGKRIADHGGRKYSRDDVQGMMHAVNQGDLTFQTMLFLPRSRELSVVFGPGPVSDQPMTTIPLQPLFDAPLHPKVVDSAAKSGGSPSATP